MGARGKPPARRCATPPPAGRLEHRAGCHSTTPAASTPVLRPLPRGQIGTSGLGSPSRADGAGRGRSPRETERRGTSGTPRRARQAAQAGRDGSGHIRVTPRRRRRGRGVTQVDERTEGRERRAGGRTRRRLPAGSPPGALRGSLSAEARPGHPLRALTCSVRVTFGPRPRLHFPSGSPVRPGHPGVSVRVTPGPGLGTLPPPRTARGRCALATASRSKYLYHGLVCSCATQAIRPGGRRSGLLRFGAAVAL